MTNKIHFRELRQLLLEIGFQEAEGPREVVFRHEPSDTLFMFRRYCPSDAVASYNVIDVQNMLDARDLMSAETFENQFNKTPA